MTLFTRSIFFFWIGICIAMPAHAAPKEKLVLMPLRLSDEDKNLQDSMESALVKGLRRKYEVFSGDRVQKTVTDVFKRESAANRVCDETRCMQDIAMNYQAELIAVAAVTKHSGGYFLSLSIRNVIDDLAVQSESIPCRGCDTFEVVEKLADLAGEVADDVPAQQEAAQEEPVQEEPVEDAPIVRAPVAPEPVKPVVTRPTVTPPTVKALPPAAYSASTEYAGSGKYTWSNGDSYQGDMENGQRTGKGIYIWADGKIYEGDWVNNQQTGQGKFIAVNGDRYVGEFLNGKRHGRGVFIWKDGRRYDGDWVSDQQTGTAHMTYANGDIYEGDFVNGDRTGNGKYLSANGDVYEGEYLNGKRHGTGIYLAADGKSYEGEWRNDRQHGQGKYISANGDVFEGRWASGKLENN